MVRYTAVMPLYEFKCAECDERFEVRRPMSEASDPVDCPNGHVGARRLLSVFASVGTATAAAPASAPAPSGGGCCGGMCGC